MTQEVINVGSNPNDGTGDPIRTSFIKVNNNFSQLFSLSVGADSRFNANAVVTTNTNSNLHLAPNGGGWVVTDFYNKLYVSNSDASSSSVTGALLVQGGIGATTAGIDTAYVGNITATGNFIGNLNGTATNAILATTATYATTSGLATNALHYAGTALPNVTAVGGNITMDNSGNVTVIGTVSAFNYIHGVQIANLSSSTSQTVGNQSSVLVLDSTAGATIASATITLPANANVSSGQMFTLSSNITVTTLTVSAGSGTAINGAPSTITTASSYRWVFYRPGIGTATWLVA